MLVVLVLVSKVEKLERTVYTYNRKCLGAPRCLRTVALHIKGDFGFTSMEPTALKKWSLWELRQHLVTFG